MCHIETADFFFLNDFTITKIFISFSYNVIQIGQYIFVDRLHLLMRM